jgi:hypothetical protein
MDGGTVRKSAKGHVASHREFFLKRWEQEYPTFLKVFRA